MTVFESINLMIGFGTMIATVIIGVLTVVMMVLSNRKLSRCSKPRLHKQTGA